MENLFDAAKTGDLATLTRLLEEGVNGNATDEVSAPPCQQPPHPWSTIALRQPSPPRQPPPWSALALRLRRPPPLLLTLTLTLTVPLTLNLTLTLTLNLTLTLA